MDARDRLWGLLGGAPRETVARIVAEEALPDPAPGVALSRLVFDDLGLGRVPALLARPRAGGPRPVVLHLHAHGGRYDIGKRELTEGRPALPGEAYALAWPSAGLAALSFDLPCFGERAGLDEAATARARHWRGDTLFGQMLREAAAMVGFLGADPRFRADRIGAFGVSMGATLAWWLAALDVRVAAVADLCCFADLETLVGTGAHALHGPYMTVPGLLPAFRSGEIAGLAAPRPKLVRVGLDDSLTPPAAFERAKADLVSAYESAGARDQLDIAAATGGHVETAAMRADVLRFMARALQ